MRELRAVLSCGNRLHKHRPSRWLPMGLCKLFIWSGDYRFALTCLRGHGIWLSARDSHATLRGLLPSVVYHERKPSMKKRAVKGSSEGAKHLAAVESSRFADLMSLVEHCAIRQYDDGDARETGWITLKTQGAAWVVQVKDPDGACSFSAIADTLDKALETAALMLSCDEAPWEPDAFLAASAARRKKK